MQMVQIVQSLNFLTQCVKKLLQLITMYERYINIQHSDDI